MTKNAAHGTFWRTSDAIVAATLLLGFALDSWLAAWRIADAALRMALGAPLIVGGVAVIVLAKRALRAADQPSMPGAATTRLVTKGVYAVSRNPLYLGLTVTVLGLGLLSNIVGWTLLALPMAWVMQRALIEPEEKYLATRFGHQYHVYAQRVRRWL